jgi:hypothetical protein
LIDIPDLACATTKMVEALRPGGILLIANLTSFSTAGMPDGSIRANEGKLRFCIGDDLDERAVWACWNGIRVQNWHRQLSTHMALFLEGGLELRHFSEPADWTDHRIGRYWRACAPAMLQVFVTLRKLGTGEVNLARSVRWERWNIS